MPIPPTLFQETALLSSEMRFAFGGFNKADKVFFMVCEHPSFASIPVGVETVDGIIMGFRGPIPHSMLSIDDSSLD